MNDDASLERATEFLSGDDTEKNRQAELDRLSDRIIDAIRTVYDPEIPVNVFDLGLIYKIDVDDHNRVRVDMTLTAPGCPVADILPGEVEERVREVEGISEATVELVWDPPWHPSLMSEEAQLELGIMY